MGSTPNNAGSFRDGAPIPQEVVIYGANGQPISSTNLLSVSATIANANANGQTTMANSSPVVLASDQTPLRMATPTVAQVASSATSGTLLAANTNRRGALFYNDSTQTLYLLYGSGTASSTNYTTKVGSQQLFELPAPAIYTGQITGVWAAANGNLYVTEVTA